MRKYKFLAIVIVFVLILITGFILFDPINQEAKAAISKKSQQITKKVMGKFSKVNLKVKSYPLHKNIPTTVFWIGEAADASNNYIANNVSAWDSFWQEHYGGYDDPNHRNGYYPSGFRPRENPFYVALPYNDFDDSGNRKPNLNKIIYWASSKTWGANESMCKNRWIKIVYRGRVTYAQWEDSGPGVYNDSSYVFGTARPQNSQTGLDVSPAVRDYLGLGGKGSVDWQFVEAKSVPNGPWKEIVTTSQVSR